MGDDDYGGAAVGATNPMGGTDDDYGGRRRGLHYSAQTDARTDRQTDEEDVGDQTGQAEGVGMPLLEQLKNNELPPIRAKRARQAHSRR